MSSFAFFTGGPMEGEMRFIDDGPFAEFFERERDDRTGEDVILSWKYKKICRLRDAND